MFKLSAMELPDYRLRMDPGNLFMQVS